MERREGVKMEDYVLGNSSFSDYVASSFSLQNIFDLSCEGDKIPLGFMELLGFHDQDHCYFSTCTTTPLFDNMAAVAPPQKVVPSLTPTKIESPDQVLNIQPATPNSSSISSASSEAVNDEPPAKVDQDQEEDQLKNKKQLKPKKTNQKRQREARFAFMTKSEVDHLEDGYRWRKYGQKAVKNSPFPRSYYRCTSTSSSCNVKKRVERSFNDPSIVVTTYEGQHTHPSPLMMPRTPTLGATAHFISSGAISAPTFAMPLPMQRSTCPSNYDQHPFVNSVSPLNFGNINGSNIKDHGLLQDIIPSHMRKEE